MNAFITLNNELLLDLESFELIKNTYKNVVKHNDNLWYLENKLLLNILFDIKKFDEYKFKNRNTDDYRKNNLEIIKDERSLNYLENVVILEEGTPKHITLGSKAGETRNMYWKVKNKNNEEYYVMHIKDDIYTKFSIEDLHKVLNYNDSRPTWCFSNEYVITHTKINNNEKIIYLHQYIMNQHLEDNTNYENTVDHINQDKFDNRQSNLRIVGMSEQNSNRNKIKRQHNARNLPHGITQNDLPKYVGYYKQCYDEKNNSWREFFTIEGHPKLEQYWSSSKSCKFTINEKLDQVKLKLKHIEEQITDEEYYNMTNNDPKLPVHIRFEEEFNKLKLVFDKKFNNKRYNLDMVLTNNDLQIMLDKFINKINIKYPDLKFNSYKLDKPTILDFSTFDNVITEDVENKSPDLPPNFSLYKEDDNWYLQYSKTINTIRFSKKRQCKTGCIQTELNMLIKIINIEFKDDIHIENYTIKNPYDMINKSYLYDNIKPELSCNFSVCNVHGIDYIQFCKKINNKNCSWKTKVDSNDLSDVLSRFVSFLNEKHLKKYDINLTNVNVYETHGWKTTNKI